MFKIKDLFKRKPKVKLDPLLDPKVEKEYTFGARINLLDGSIAVDYKVNALNIMSAERYSLERARSHCTNGCTITRIPNTTLVVPPHFIKNIEVDPKPSSIKLPNEDTWLI